MLYTASFYAPQDWVGQSYRVSRQHPRGRRVQWEVLPFFYPDRELFRAYRNGDIDFAGLADEYRNGLDQKQETMEELQEWLRAAPSSGDFTLLCFEPNGEPCHRIVLARWLLEHAPLLGEGNLR